MLGAVGMAVAVLCAQARLDAQAAARLQTRARSATEVDLTPQGAGDAEVTATLRGAVENRGGTLALTYSPTVRVREPYSSNRRSELNQLQTFSAQWTREGRPRLYVNETLSWGRTDLGVARRATPIAVGLINEAFVDASGGVEWPVSRLSSLDTQVGFTYTTGLDEASRVVAPAQRSYRGRATYRSLLTPADTLGVQANVSYVQFPGLQLTLGVADLGVRWRRQLLARLTGEVGVLAAAFYAVGPERPAGAFAVPGAEATLGAGLSEGIHAVRVDAGLRALPFVDRYLASAFLRGELSTELNYTYRQRWVVTLRGSVQRSLTPVGVRDGPDTSTAFSTYVELQAGYVAQRYWRVDVTGANSTFVLGNTAPVHNWLVGLSLTVQAGGQW